MWRMLFERFDSTSWLFIINPRDDFAEPILYMDIDMLIPVAKGRTKSVHILTLTHKQTHMKKYDGFISVSV